jgi:hypothetical protein
MIQSEGNEILSKKKKIKEKERAKKNVKINSVHVFLTKSPVSAHVLDPDNVKAKIHDVERRKRDSVQK